MLVKNIKEVKLCELKGWFMKIVKFVSFVVRLGFVLALAGQLKFCTLVMLGKAAEKSQKGIMWYSKYTRMLTSNQTKK